MTEEMTNEQAAQKAKESLDAEIKVKQEQDKEIQSRLEGKVDGEANDTPKS